MASEDEDDLLLDGQTIGKSTFFRQDPTFLPYEETVQLQSCLATATEILTNHMIALREQQAACSTWDDLWSKRPKRCLKIRACWKKFLHLMTGAKGITFTVILQLINLIMLQLVDSLPRKKDERATALEWGTIIMLGLQILNLIVVLAISVQLAKQIFHRKISGILLVQSYFATILLFSGIYTATYRLETKAWKFIGEDLDRDPLLLVELYCKFLFFSTSTATLCGSADTLPDKWYTCLFTSVQMLLSFLYFTSVIGHAVAPLTSDTNRQPSLPRPLEPRPLHDLLTGDFNKSCVINMSTSSESAS